MRLIAGELGVNPLQTLNPVDFAEKRGRKDIALVINGSVIPSLERTYGSLELSCSEDTDIQHASAVQFNFLDLPGELRNVVYSYTHKTTSSWRQKLAPSIVESLTRMRQNHWMMVQPNTRPETSLTLVNKQTRQEALSHFFSTHQFAIEDGCYPVENPLPFLRSLAPVKGSLRSLTIDCRWFPYFWNGAARGEGDKIWTDIAKSTELESLYIVMRPGSVCRALEEEHGQGVLEEWDAAKLAVEFLQLSSIQSICQIKVGENVNLMLPEDFVKWTGRDNLSEVGKKEEFLNLVNDGLWREMSRYKEILED